MDVKKELQDILTSCYKAFGIEPDDEKLKSREEIYVFARIYRIIASYKTS